MAYIWKLTLLGCTGGGETAHFWRSIFCNRSKFYFSLKSSICELWPKNFAPRKFGFSSKSSICELWPKIFRSAKVRFFAQKFYLRTFALSHFPKVRKFGKRTFRQRKFFALKSSICELWPKNFRSAKVRFFVKKFYLGTFALSQSSKVRKKNFWSTFFIPVSYTHLTLPTILRV